MSKALGEGFYGLVCLTGYSLLILIDRLTTIWFRNYVTLLKYLFLGLDVTIRIVVVVCPSFNVPGVPLCLLFSLCRVCWWLLHLFSAVERWGREQQLNSEGQIQPHRHIEMPNTHMHAHTHMRTLKRTHTHTSLFFCTAALKKTSPACTPFSVLSSHKTACHIFTHCTPFFGPMCWPQ